MVKLTEEEIQEILDNPQNLSIRKLAFKYNVAHMTIWNIRNKPFKSIEENGLYKTSLQDRLYIKNHKGIKSHIELALMFNISWRQVYNIWNEGLKPGEEELTFDDYYEEREFKMAQKRKLMMERKKNILKQKELEKAKLQEQKEKQAKKAKQKRNQLYYKKKKQNNEK